jgi:hydroxyacylglutathione hydrolase
MASIHHLIDEGLGNCSYLVELSEGRAMAVDPGRDPAPWLELAGRHRLRLAYTAETHLHADFVSGSRELAAHGAQVLAARAAGLAFEHRGLDDGDELDLGGLTLRAVASPGHTPEHLAYLLLDGARPLALFSGGALLAGGVARTDLTADEATEALTRAAWRSVHDRLLVLPDDLTVYPTHGAGSLCSGGAPGDQVGRSTTIGAERAANPLLAGVVDEDGFVAALLGGLGSYPPYFRRLRAVNQAGPPVLGDHGHRLPAHDPGQVLARLREGAVLVDARPLADSAAGRPAGALSIELRPTFATWLGWLLEPDRPLVFLLGPEQEAGELVRQCHKIGYDRLVGELAGGMAAWSAVGLPEERTELIGPERLGDGPLIDVRQADEVAAGRVPGAVAVEFGALGGPGAVDRLGPAAPTRGCCWAGRWPGRRSRAGPWPGSGVGYRPRSSRSFRCR